MELLKKILVPVDGSEHAERALELVGPLLKHSTGPIELLRLVRPLQLGSPLRPLRAGQDALLEKERASAYQYLRALGRGFKRAHAEVQADFTHHVDTAEPASGILRRVEVTQPSLVVMATHGRSGLSRWIRGSVAEKVLRHTCSPLLLVHSESPKRFQRVLVPLDGSEASAEVVALAGTIANAFDGQVILLHVGMLQGAELMDSEAGAPVLVTEKLIHDGLEPYRRALEEGGVPARVRAGFGDPAGKILEAVVEEEIDLIAMTSHGRSGLDRWVFGSVAEKVLRHCKLPLLVLPLRGRLPPDS